MAAGQDVELELEEGALLLEDLAAKRPRPARARAAAGRGDGDPPHELLARGAARRRRPTTRSWRSCAGLPDARLLVVRPAPALGRPAAPRPRRLVRAVPAVLRRLQGRGRAPARTSPTSASTSSTCRPSTRSAPPTARAATTRLTPRPDDPGQPVGDRHPPRAATTPSTPTSARIDDFDAFVAARRRARPRGRARLRAAVQPRPPLGARPPRVVQPAARRLDPLRREPAEEVPGHPPDRLLAGRGRRPRRALGGVPRRPRALDRRTASGCSASTTRTPSRCAFWAWVIADVHEPPPRRRVPGRGVHRPRR